MPESLSGSGFDGWGHGSCGMVVGATYKLTFGGNFLMNLPVSLWLIPDLPES